MHARPRFFFSFFFFFLKGFSCYSRFDKVGYLKRCIKEASEAGGLGKKPIRMLLRYDPLKVLSMTQCPDDGVPCEWWPTLLDETRRWAMDAAPDLYRVNLHVSGGSLPIWDHLPCERLDQGKTPQQSLVIFFLFLIG